MQKLIILDRDGVINRDSDQYIKSPDEWVAIPGSLATIARLNRAGFLVAVATNQSGIARGLFTLDTLTAIHHKMQQQLLAVDGHIDQLVFCPHHPDDNCNCRKPKPGLYQQIAQHFAVDLSHVPVVGDSARDLEAAQAVNATPILVRTGKGLRTLAKEPDLAHKLCFDDLAQTVNYLLRSST